MVKVASPQRKGGIVNSRTKGKVGEREASEVLRQLGFTSARRGVQYQGSPDSPDVVGIPGVHVEVKRVERLNIDAAMAQARADAGPSQVPIVMHRRNRGVWMVTVDIANLKQLAAIVAGMKEQA